MSTPLVRIHPTNVQGIVAHTYPYPRSRHLLFRLGSPRGARAFVRGLPPVTAAADFDPRQAGVGPPLVNVALSFPGLKATGVLREEALAAFPSDFQGGPTPERLHDGASARW